jgi:hypothetical protein
MTSDDGPLGRQMMQQLSVAMVDDVEKVKLMFPALQPSLVIPEAIQQPIGIEEVS